MKPTVHPIENILPVPGLQAPFTILQITDLHACAKDEDEAAAMSVERFEYSNARIGLFSQGRPYPPEALLPAFRDFAREIQADLILMTGDILDFPSEANFRHLEDFIRTAPAPVQYITGNHDWSYADDYQTPAAMATYLPRVTSLAGAEQNVVVFETDAVTVITLDNGRYHIPATTAEVYANAQKCARAAGKTVVLAMHIPFKVDTLVEDTVRVWRQDLCLGEGATSGDDVDTVSFWRAVTEGQELAPDVVITGHLHFDHEDVYPNGVPQFVTDIASGGHCRVIRLVPET